MCVELLNDGNCFRRYRLPLADFVDPLDPKVLFPRPEQYFRRSRGLYITGAVRNEVIPYLEARPKDCSATQLLVWELTQDQGFGKSVNQCDGSRDPLLWWIISPLLAWQQRGDDRTILPTDMGAYFFLSLKKDKDTTHEALKLSFHPEALHGEWWLDLVSADEKQKVCRVGQTFLSVK